MRSASLNRSGGGYTLVEVLVAVTVFAILAGSAHVALTGLSRAAEQHRERAAGFADLQMTVARLDADLRQLATRPVRTADGSQAPALVGERISLSATRAGWDNPSDRRRSSLQRFDWQLSDGSLVRVGWPVTDRAPNVRPVSSIRFEPVQAFELRYRDAEGRWRDRWPDRADAAGLPAAIEVVIESEAFGRIRRLVVLD